MSKNPVRKLSEERNSAIWARIKNWGIKGGSAILDQGIFSGSNFVFNILLARWLTQEDYGIFSMVFGIYLFASSFHNALILEPMTILGPSKYPERLRTFIFTQLQIHFPFAALMGGLMIVAGWMFRQSPTFSSVLISTGLALPFLLLIWLVRRAFYVIQKPSGALFTSVLYTIFLAIGLWALKPVSIVTIFPLMGAASLFGSVLMLVFGGLVETDASKFFDLHEQVLHQFHYGKPLFIAAFLYTAGSQFQVFVTGSLVSISSAGIWRALQNFALPITQMVTAVSVLILPILSAEFGRGNFQSMRRKGFVFMAALTFMTILYEIVLLLGYEHLEFLLYGGKFAAYAWLIPVVGALGIFTAIEAGFAAIVRALQKPIYHAVYGAVSLVSSLVFATWLIAYWGVSGAVVSQLIVGFSILCGTITLYFYYFPNQEK
jgi:O-antigen/teichoic acid export membrane protein